MLHKLRRFVGTILKSLHIDYTKSQLYKSYRYRVEREEKIAQQDMLISLYQLPVNKILKNKQYQNEIVGFIFSFDRAFQLYSLLKSIEEKFVTKMPIYVFYRASSNEHKKAYDEVLSIFKNLHIIPILQNSKETFREEYLSALDNISSEKIIFFVDDIVITEKFDYNDVKNLPLNIFTPTLRLGANTTYSYTMDCESKSKKFLDNALFKKYTDVENKLFWQWKDGVADWAYSISVDGSIFDFDEILLLSHNTDFTSPNVYEYFLNSLYAPLFSHKIALVYKKSKLVNMPINKVQQDKFNVNRSGNVDTNYLLDLWNQGYEMDLSKIYGYVNNSPHEEIPLNVIKRDVK